MKNTPYPYQAKLLAEIEAFTKAIEKWNGVLPSTVLGGSSSALLNFNKKGE